MKRLRAWARARALVGQDWLGRALWRPGVLATLRLALITAIVGGAMGRRSLLTAVAEGGAQALAEDPRTTLALIRALRERGACPLLICGDSHSRAFVQRGRRAKQWLLPLHHLATAASARGLANASSRSGEGQRLRAQLDGVAREGGGVPVLLVFGQVDIEFIFPLKRLEAEPPMDHDPAVFTMFCRETAGAYAEFAASLPMQVSLAAIFPPALSDAAWRDGYVNAHIAAEHSSLDADRLRQRLAGVRIENMRARTLQHAEFNQWLAEAAAQRSLGRLEFFSEILGPGGVAADRYTAPAGGRDHHLNMQTSQPEISAKLWAMVDSCAQQSATDDDNHPSRNSLVRRWGA